MQTAFRHLAERSLCISLIINKMYFKLFAAVEPDHCAGRDDEQEDKQNRADA
jgi:hypothetical protein